jgi:hypothetical protein
VRGYAFTTLAVALATSPVHAEEPAPGFLTLNRFSRESKGGLEIGFAVIDGSDDAWPRLDLHAQFVDEDSGFGGYAQIPFVMRLGSRTGQWLGNLEIGAIYEPCLRIKPLRIAYYLGVGMPTADTDDDRTSEVQTIRLTDAYMQSPDTVALRVGVSPIIRAGHFIARADLQAQAQLQGDRDLDPNLGLSVGAGAVIGPVAITAEAVTMIELTDDARSLTSLALALRGGHRVQFFGGIGFPVAGDHPTLLSFFAGLESRL